jgi:hypothetical protein
MSQASSSKEKRHPNNILACLGHRKKRHVAKAIDIAERTFYAIIDEEAPLPDEKIEPLARYLGVSHMDLFKKREIWNVPYLRNPFFTGREKELDRLYRALHTNRAVAVTQLAYALSGLGGIASS